MTRMVQCRDVWLMQRDAKGSERVVLEGINADFRSGCISLITGVTGAGKSTLLHILGGLLRPSRGQVIADGEPVSRWTTSHRDMWRRSVGIAFQSHHLIDDLTALENVMLPMVPRGTQLDALRKLAREALEALGITHLAAESITALSWGERQRVVLARAIVSRPQYLLVDEPTAHQDDAGAEIVVNCLLEAKNMDTVVVVATHDPRLRTGRVGDDLWHLEAGRLHRDRQEAAMSLHKTVSQG